MPKVLYRDDSSYIQSSNIFEWTPSEKVLMKKNVRNNFDTVVDTLNEIGYYGVKQQKISDLDPFETLIGGISWCIGYIRPELSRNITYSSGMSLGKKITLSERIILCLRQMKYPNSLCPQQIQGMDFKAMIKVLRWLQCQINEIRSSLPAAECVAAQCIFEDEFTFDLEDCPSINKINAWLPYTKNDYNHSTESQPMKQSFIETPLITSCHVDTINTLPSFLHRIYESESSYSNDNYSIPSDLPSEGKLLQDLTYSRLTKESDETSDNKEIEERQSQEVINLLRLRQRCIESIVQMKEKEKYQILQLNEYKKQYFKLQDYYRGGERAIQNLAIHERNEETVAKLQELRNLMKLLESLNLQRNTNKQVFNEELNKLRKEMEAKKADVECDNQQYLMISGINEKVMKSLNSLLSIYRTVNLAILKYRCILEKIPTKPELLFYEQEMKSLISLISDKTIQLSRYHDVLNNLSDTQVNCMMHYQFLCSLLQIIQTKKFIIFSANVVVNEKLNFVIQQLTKLVQQYNIELKKRNKVYITTSENHSVTMEKVRLHNKTMQIFKEACERNTTLIKKLRQLQRQISV